MARADRRPAAAWGASPASPPDRQWGGWPPGRFLFCPAVSRKAGQTGGKWAAAVPRKAGVRSPVRRVLPIKAEAAEAGPGRGPEGPDPAGPERKEKQGAAEAGPGRGPLGPDPAGPERRAERRGAPGWTR